MYFGYYTHPNDGQRGFERPGLLIMPRPVQIDRNCSQTVGLLQSYERRTFIDRRRHSEMLKPSWRDGSDWLSQIPKVGILTLGSGGTIRLPMIARSSISASSGSPPRASKRLLSSRTIGAERTTRFQPCPAHVHRAIPTSCSIICLATADRLRATTTQKFPSAQ